MSEQMSDGGAVCSRCKSPALRKQGNQYLCVKHYRFGSMRSRARKDGKLVPTHEELELMSQQGDSCPDCHRKMNWLAKDGAATVVTLQHYRDGTMSLVCLSCNTRHASMPGDTYRDMPNDHKRCPSCDQAKPSTEFTTDNSRSGELRRKSSCRECSDKKVNAWKESNRERYNEYQRQYRAQRKANGNPVASGS